MGHTVGLQFRKYSAGSFCRFPPFAEADDLAVDAFEVADFAHPFRSDAAANTVTELFRITHDTLEIFLRQQAFITGTAAA